MRNFIVCMALAACLGACVPTGAISGKAVDYNSAVEQIDDQLLVVNILRARDQLPLHFGDVASIHGSMQVTAGVASTFNFGRIFPATATPNTVTPTLSFQDAPSFDMSNLDSQDFITGIMSPISPKVVKYWADRGPDKRMVMLLFFSSVEITVNQSPNVKGLSKGKPTF